ncbi:MAG: tetratricopeptide repeat protein [Deltaproteobacteria bacterium]|nr:tetratricopeptide repeat protein [Deltaproteobacteria bacterium]
MICPKCGRPVDESAVICRGCDFILDTQFLGDGILDEEHELRPGQGGVDPAAFNLADAVILGNIDEDSQSFETSDSGFHLSANMQARLYVSGRSQAMMAPDAVPALAQSIEGVRLTPFERHVLNFIDGRRPVEVIRRAAGLDEAEVKTALATLADKGVVKVVGRALADWDASAETVPKRAPQRPRVRGSMVGAVALVGDDADRAIDAAFRTQVLALPESARLMLNDEGGPFAKGDGAQGDSGKNDSMLPDDADQFVGLKGTDELKKKETTTSTVRPADVKQAVNRVSPPTGAMLRPELDRSSEDSQEGIDASAELSAVGVQIPKSRADPSDGFDDFSAPSVVSTAVLDGAAPSSSLPSEPSPRAKSGVFAESDSGGAPIAAVEQLADSRLRKRPDPAPARGSPPALVSESASGNLEPPRAAAVRASARSPADSVMATHASELGSSSGAKSEEIERRAASGEVWGESPNPATGESASLMQLLSEGDSNTANVPPEHAARMLAGRDGRGGGAPSSGEVSEEPTAAGQPPPPLKLPRLPGMAAAPLGAVPLGAAPPPPPRRRAPASGLVSMPDEHATGPIDEHSGLHGAPGARQAARADSDEGDDEGFEGPETHVARPHKSSSTGEPPPRQRPGAAPPRRTPARPQATVSPPANPSSAASGDDSRDDSQHSDSSVELLDSGLVIRPAAKAVPLSAALKHTRQAESSNPRNRPMADPPSATSTPRPRVSAEGDGQDSYSARGEDPEDTVNLEPSAAARVAAGPRVAVAGPRGVAAIPSGFSQVVAPEQVPRAKAAVNDDVRRKAVKLMDEARKEFAAGRLASARMNAKLASIYDPDNEEIRALQRQWDQPQPATAGRAPPPSKNSDEAQAEIKALYDRAQALEDDEDIDGALDVLEEGIERFPNEAAFHNRMGVILALKKRDYEGAVAAIQRAIEIAPDNLHYKNNLGKIVAKVRVRQPEA